MGIPVALAEWTVPFHANILQRVPMNPNRDALASGYAKRIHRACLPALLPELNKEAITAVGLPRDKARRERTCRTVAPAEIGPWNFRPSQTEHWLKSVAAVILFTIPKGEISYLYQPWNGSIRCPDLWSALSSVSPAWEAGF